MDQRRRSSARQAQSWDYRTLVEALLWPSNTRGVAFCVLRALPTDLAKRTFANAIGNMADNANAHSDATRRELKARVLHRPDGPCSSSFFLFGVVWRAHARKESSKQKRRRSEKKGP